MRWGVGAVAVLVMMRGVLFLTLIPPWQAPDENGHFEYARLLADHWRPLTASDSDPAIEQAILDSLYAHHAWEQRGLTAPQPRPDNLAEAAYFNRPRTVLQRFSLSYLPYAVAVWPFRKWAIEMQLYAMRFVSVGLNVILTMLAIKTARLLAPHRPELGYGAALFLALWPQHTFLMASVNDGNLAECLSACTLYFFVRMIVDGATWSRALGCVVTLLGALFSKATAYSLVPVMLIGGVHWLWTESRSRRMRIRAGWLAALGGLFLLFFGAFSLYRELSSQIGFIQDSLYSGGLGSDPALARLLSLNVSGRFSLALWETFTSFVMTFGWMTVRMPPGWYVLAASALTLAFAGWCQRRNQWPRNAPESFAWRVLELAAVMPVAILIAWFVGAGPGLDYYQGRYLFTASMPMTLILTAGILGVLPVFYGRLALFGAVASLWLLDVAALWHTVAPYFIQNYL
jgi:hypothetical protein